MPPLFSIATDPTPNQATSWLSPKSGVAKERRIAIVPTDREAPYRVTMGNDQAATNGWGEYLKHMTSRPGWSVARLAREAPVNRATIFKWISGKTGVTVASVRLIAKTLGDDPNNALRAAAGSVITEDGQEGGDALVSAEEKKLISTDPRLNDIQRTRVLKLLHDRRARRREDDLNETRMVIDAVGEAG